MQLRLLDDAKFTCSCCAKCCRGWHVELLDGEAAKLRALAWPSGDPLAIPPAMFEHGAKVYLPHEADGACVYLNRTTGLCRIHERFGLEAKPLGCQLYPFRIARTFDEQLASVTYRFDCPTVRKNQGEPMERSRGELLDFARRMVLTPPFDSAALKPFDREQVSAVCEFVATLLSGFESDDQRALFIFTVCDWLGAADPAEVDRAALARAFPSLREIVRATSSVAVTPPGIVHRTAFRTLLGLYLRRDEDVLNGHASRPARLVAMMKLVAGRGSFSELGVSHPGGMLRNAGLFASTPARADPAASALIWRMIRSKLDSFQFMGSANPGHGFVSGLRTLALLYPLVVAAAKYSAGNRAAAVVEESDIDFAVGAIEHSYGRGALLRLPFARSIERFLLEPTGFVRLVRGV
jgi:Fe-S-cluster containining protein